MKLFFASLLLIVSNISSAIAYEQIMVCPINIAVSRSLIAAGKLTITDQTDYNVKIICDQDTRTCILYGRNLVGGNAGTASIMGGPAVDLMNALHRTPGVVISGAGTLLLTETFGNVSCSDDGYSTSCDVRKH